MASETMQQRDPGDECDATGCSCGREPDWLSPVLRSIRENLAGMPPEAAGSFNVPAELFSPAAQPEERKP